jgi:hypothetical protein
MSKKLPKKASSEFVKCDPVTERLGIKIPSSEDCDGDSAQIARVKAVQARLDEIKKLLEEPHSFSGLTNKSASLLDAEKKQLQSFIELYKH